MTNVLILGAGKQAEGCAWYLANESSVEKIGIASRSEGSIDKLMKSIGSKKLAKHILDVTDKKETKEVMEGYDAAINALPTRETSYASLEASIEVGLDMVDMLEEYHRKPDKYEMEGLDLPEGMSVEEYGEHLHEKALENDVTFVDGMGFAPGLTNFTLGKGLREMDKGKSAIARCGGIPEKKAAEKRPLKYMITWAFDHVLREYMIKSPAIKNGERTEIQALTEHKKFIFDKFGQDEELECAVTPGMPSFVYTRSELEETYEKTVRWPGHYDAIKTFKECGMLDNEPIPVRGKEVVPREVLSAAVTPKLKPEKGDKDVCVMWNTAEGEKNGEPLRIDYYMWDEADAETGLTAMQRTTGFPPAITAEMLAKDKIPEKGIVPPEDCIKNEIYEEMMERLEKVDIQVLEEKR
ncbi:MAG: saccharopine dehydrogenase NADP-binding domain-containing protein [Candidatus Thermoplasmatota archaeon]|nr:saccharopine dehydrogenase NADP-binding domain-containing protein [Candidatus Thermoplasmatota archaeon]